MAGLELTNGNRTQGRYSRARGLGADDMLRTAAGLWIASDNFDGSVTCGGVPGHAGICSSPTPSRTRWGSGIRRPSVPCAPNVPSAIAYEARTSGQFFFHCL